MKFTVICSLVLTIATASVSFAQTATPHSSPTGLELLQRAAQHYAGAKSFHIEAIEERTTNNDFEHSWYKSILIVAEEPGSRFHYEGRAAYQDAVRASDGKTVWTFYPFEHGYTAKPATPDNLKPAGVIPQEEMTLWNAKSLRSVLANVAQHYKSATRHGDEVVTLNGRRVLCYVVWVETTDRKRVDPETSFEEIYWIDQRSETIIKSFRRARSYLIGAAGHVPIEEETTTTYPIVELDVPLQAALFNFVPPSDAKLIDHFPDQMKNGGGPDLTGEVAPPLQFKAANGKVVPLESFRGQPLLLDIWATWCSPCIKNLEEIARVERDIKDRAVVVISVDEDEESKTATDFLRNKHYDWLNFHDQGEVNQALGSSSVPRTLLIDPQGRIVFDRVRYSDEELRVAIAKLGPHFAYLAPKPATDPCGPKTEASRTPVPPE